MVSALTTAVSGLNAASTRINVAANNIANAESTQTQNSDGTVSNTPYQAQRVAQISQSGGGVQAKVENAPGGPQQVYDPSNAAANAQGVTNMPNVDQGNELVQMSIATYDFQANLKTIEAKQHQEQSLLNIIT